MSIEPVIRFCATGRRGLGHLRRIANVAKPLAARGNHRLELITNAPVAGIAREEIEMFEHIHVTPRDQFASTLKSRGKGPIVVDTACIDGLGMIDDPLVLILRETRASALSRFRLEEHRPWDQVLVPNPADYWSVEPSSLGAKRVDYVGWIYRHQDLATQSNGLRHAVAKLKLPDRLNVLIACGGGGHITPEYKQTLESIALGLRHALHDRVVIIQAVGPRSNRDALIKNVNIAHDFGYELHQAFSAADIVISTAGYNSVLELAVTSTPTLLFPVDTTYDDQGARTARWGHLLGHGHSDIKGSIDWLTHLCTQYKRRNEINIGPSGADQVAQHIEALV